MHSHRRTRRTHGFKKPRVSPKCMLFIFRLCNSRWGTRFIVVNFVWQMHASAEAPPAARMRMSAIVRPFLSVAAGGTQRFLSLPAPARDGSQGLGRRGTCLQGGPTTQADAWACCRGLLIVVEKSDDCSAWKRNHHITYTLLRCSGFGGAATAGAKSK